MILQDYLDEKVAFECHSEVEINSMLCILKEIDNENFVETFKKIRKDAENNSEKPFFIFFRKNNTNNCLINTYIWSYKVVKLTKELYKEMKKDLENKNYYEKIIISPTLNSSKMDFSYGFDTVATIADEGILAINVNNLKLEGEERKMINLDGFLNKYKEMIEEKLMKERKEKVNKLKEKDCYTIQVKKIKDALVSSFNGLIKDNGEETDLIHNSDVDVLIKNRLSEDFISKETKEKITKIEIEEIEKIKELDNKIKEIKVACMLSTNEEKIQQILINYKIITKDGKLII